MVFSLGLILRQLVGEAIAHGTGVLVPGPVIGLVLCVLLLGRDHGHAAVEPSADH
jgi:holin-like protein